MSDDYEQFDFAPGFEIEVDKDDLLPYQGDGLVELLGEDESVAVWSEDLDA